MKDENEATKTEQKCLYCETNPCSLPPRERGEWVLHRMEEYLSVLYDPETPGLPESPLFPDESKDPPRVLSSEQAFDLTVNDLREAAAQLSMGMLGKITGGFPKTGTIELGTTMDLGTFLHETLSPHAALPDKKKEDT